MQELFANVTENWFAIIGGLTTIVVALIALFEMIPGEQPEKTLKAVLKFITKLSRK